MLKYIAMTLAAVFSISIAMAGDDYTGSGTVNAVKTKERKLNITHGPIKGLMDGMTMDFAVMDPAMLDEVAPGSKITFTLSKDRSGSFVITELETTAASNTKK